MNLERLVKQAAKWLDRERAGWWAGINTATLNMPSNDCILGQTFGTEGGEPYTALERVSNDLDLNYSERSAVFCSNESRPLWIMEIEKRRRGEVNMSEAEWAAFQRGAGIGGDDPHAVKALGYTGQWTGAIERINGRLHAVVEMRLPLAELS